MEGYKETVFVDSSTHKNSEGYHVWVVLTDADGNSFQFSYGPAAEGSINGVRSKLNSQSALV